MGRLKGTVSRDFWPFFCLKDSTWAPYEQAKTVSWTISFSQRYSRKTGVCVVNDYADTVSVYSTTTWTSCRWLCWHTGNYFTLEKVKTDKKVTKNVIWYFQKIAWTRAEIVNDYADTFGKFEAFSQILKEQSVKKRYLDVFTHPITII